MRKHLKKYFIPHAENDHQPHILRDKSIGVIVGTALLIQIIAFLVITPAVSNKIGYIASILPAILVEKTNESRLENGENQLIFNATLAAAAQLKANDMAEKGYFSHISPDGKSPWYWVQKAGYVYNDAGENLAVNFVDSDDVHDAWMKSPGHRENILRNGFTEIGIATAEGVYEGRSAIFVVQYFGKPRVVAIEVTNETDAMLAREKTVLSPVAKPFQLGSTNVSERSSAQVLGDQQLATSTAAISSVESVTWYQKLIASPRHTLATVLGILAALVALALALKILIKRHIQYPKLILNGVLALSIILVLIGVSHVMGGVMGTV